MLFNIHLNVFSIFDMLLKHKKNLFKFFNSIKLKL